MTAPFISITLTLPRQRGSGWEYTARLNGEVIGVSDEVYEKVAHALMSALAEIQAAIVEDDQ
jgi:hypothetical protein